jgi:glycosyltransferase involved in cell wall biosynthesis
MREVGEGGGCLMVDTSNVSDLANAIVQLAQDKNLRRRLGAQATERQFTRWLDYGRMILSSLAAATPPLVDNLESLNSLVTRSAFHAPLLSICITTYNRAAWLAVCLPLVLRWTAPYRDVIEIIVCDNTSTDNTPDIATRYLDESGFYYYRNPANVGMLGNLKVTAHHARGQYVWILGDDDLICEGTVERLLEAIVQNQDVSLIYLNYSYTNLLDANSVGNLHDFLKSGIPITPPTSDRVAPIKELATLSENFFTAIYCLVFRRDHALRAYSQNVYGRPFSTMLTSIPTSYYVCNYMMEEEGCWIGTPAVIVNMNVSWGRYAPLWILERLPELYDLAERNGAILGEVNRWRTHTLQAAPHYLEKIYLEDMDGNRAHFSIERFFERHKHLPKFLEQLQTIMRIYTLAHQQKISGAEIAPADLLDRFALRQYPAAA